MGGNESLLVEKAVVQEEKDERIKKGMSRKRAQCVGNSSCWPWPALIGTKSQSVIDRNIFLKLEPIKEIMCLSVCVRERDTARKGERWQAEKQMEESRKERRNTYVCIIKL